METDTGSPDDVDMNIWMLIDVAVVDEEFRDTCFYTNLADEEAAIKFLSAFLETQLDRGKDIRAAKYKELYEVDIGFNTDTETFGWDHNCTNKDLAVGLIMDLLQKFLRSQKIREVMSRRVLWQPGDPLH